MSEANEITSGMSQLSLSGGKRKATDEGPSVPKRVKKKFGERLKFFDVSKKRAPRTVDIITYVSPIDQPTSFYLDSLPISPSPTERQLLYHTFVRSSSSSSSESDALPDLQTLSGQLSGDDIAHATFSQPPSSPEAVVPCATSGDKDNSTASAAAPSIDSSANATASTPQCVVNSTSAVPLDSVTNAVALAPSGGATPDVPANRAIALNSNVADSAPCCATGGGESGLPPVAVRTKKRTKRRRNRCASCEVQTMETIDLLVFRSELSLAEVNSTIPFILMCDECAEARARK